MTTQPVFLRVLRQGEVVIVKQFTSQQIVVGREGDVGLRLEDLQVSPIHCMVERRETGYFLCDLGSAQGTWKNGKRILDESLASGDQITVGPFTLEFFIGVPKPLAKPDSTAAAPSASAPRAAPKPPPPPPPVGAKPVAPSKPPEKPVIPTTQVPGSITAKPTPTPTVNTGGVAVAAAVARQTAQPMHSPARDALSKILKPSKGSLVEVLVTWGDRVISTYHFDSKAVVMFGSHPKNDIVLPLAGTVSSHPLLRIDSLATVFIPGEGRGLFVKGETSSTLESMIVQNKIAKEAQGHSLTLQQDEMVRIDFSENVSIFVRYAPASPKPIAAPFLFLSTGELIAILGSLVFLGVVALYLAIYQPQVEETAAEEPEPLRKAVFVYKKREKVEPEQVVGGSPQPEEKKAANQPGVPFKTEDQKPAEARPNPSQSTQKIMTGTQVGKGQGDPAAKSQQAAQKAPPKDVKKTGLLSAFARGGTQSQLQKTLEGSEAVGGLGKSASGKAGLGVGDNSNASEAGLKQVGAGGTGTAIVGISGVGTKGKGGGQLGYGEGSLGGKKSAQIIPGGAEEAFDGTIDREAIRRVILNNLRQVKSCYERGLNKNPGLDGKIVIEFNIGAGGRVTQAGVKNTTVNNSEVEQCVVSRLRTWRFPDPPADREAVVVYPFVFAPQN